MSSELVHYDAAEGVATLTLDAPPVNGYSYEMMRQLDDAILKARFDGDVHVIVLTGAGDKFFCAGADIEMLGEVTPSFKDAFCLHANETLLRLEHTPKLVIAALNGHTVGGGLEVALACDLRVIADGSAKVGMPEVALGVLPGTGGTQRLPRLVGSSKALELMVKGVNMPVAEAAALGLVHEVLPADGFRERVREYALSFCPPGKASMAVGHIKRAVKSGANLPLESGLALERELQSRLFASGDAKLGIDAYRNRQRPDFQGH